MHYQGRKSSQPLIIGYLPVKLMCLYLCSILAVINRIIDGDAKIQEHLSFLGFIPIIIKVSVCKPPISTKENQIVK